MQDEVRMGRNLYIIYGEAVCLNSGEEANEFIMCSVEVLCTHTEHNEHSLSLTHTEAKYVSKITWMSVFFVIVRRTYVAAVLFKL